MIPYTITNYNASKGIVTITVRDNMGLVHNMHVTAEGLMNHELGKGYIQDNFPELTASQREILMTGMNDTEWNQTFSEDEN